MSNSDESISGYVTSDYEGICSDFTEMELLSSRGNCNLYKAKRYGRWYLLKCLKTEYRHLSVYQQMLRKEFEVSVILQHPAVMQVTGIEEVRLTDGSNTLCLIAEYIDGCTLREYLERQPPLKERRRVAKELAETVAYIHSQQVVHRDLKPSNVMITHNGNYVKIIDFGLADTNSHAILKQPAGTMRYMAPEQMQTSVADVRNDIYSLGVIFQEMKLGGGKYRKVVDRCLKPIAQRYQQMDDLLTDLNSKRRHYIMWAAGIAAVMAVIAALVWQITKLNRQAALMREEARVQNIQYRILNHEIIGFADPEAKRLCIAHWDSDGDGELSYVEAAAVDSLGNVFTGNSKLRSFDELEHFTSLTDIDVGAFRDCVSLESVRLPASVRFIRSNAFRHTAIERFTFPGPVAGLGDHFMEDCPNLETVVFEARLPQNNMTEESVPFVNCPRLTAIFIPFYEMEYLLQGKRCLESGMSLETVYKDVFYTYVYRLWLEWGAVFPLMTDHIRFADPEVERICVKWWDRDGDHQLSIDEATKVQTLSYAFTNNPKVTTFDELRFFTGVETINNSAFDHCRNLRSVSLPSSLRIIGSWAFFHCYSLQSIRFPDHLEKLEDRAFHGCDLEEIFIPASVTHISESAFNYNSRLRRVVVSKDNPVYDSRDNCNAIIETATNTMVSGSVTAFFPRSVDKMSDEPFTGYDRPSLVIPRQVRHIGRWAFSSIIDTIYCESPDPTIFDDAANAANMFGSNPVILVPRGSRDAYAKADGWSFFADSIREN